MSEKTYRQMLEEVGGYENSMVSIPSGSVRPIIDDLESLESRNARLTEALEKLVTLKDMKDLNGDSPDYRKRKPLAWEQAREALLQE